MEQLFITWNNDAVGVITNHSYDEVILEYGFEWIQSNKPGISLSLPNPLSCHQAYKVENYLMNLIPEMPFFVPYSSEQYDQDINPHFDHMSRYGDDCPGALVFHNEYIQVKKYDEINPDNMYLDVTKEIEKILKKNTASPLPMALGARSSLAGYQDKLACHIFSDGRIGIPKSDYDAPTQYILKLLPANISHLSLNEHYCMSLASKCGLRTAETIPYQINEQKHLLVKRYDRMVLSGRLVRLHQEDMCQALGLHTGQKYQYEGRLLRGPGFAEIINILSQAEAAGKLNTKDEHWKDALLKLIIFNFIIGNSDAHAKNFSILYGIDYKITIAPAYDIFSTAPYPAYNQSLAMSYGNFGREHLFNHMRHEDWLHFAKIFGVSAKALS